ncbi:MAG: hypothetical protein ACJ73E_05220 [Mycobacteriales bacterium]
MAARPEPRTGGAQAPTRPGGLLSRGLLRTGGPQDGGDATAFLGRVTALDPAALVRLRDSDGRVTGYARLPFGVLVSRTVNGSVRPADVTVPAADLLGALEPRQGRAGEVPLPASRDVEWRAALPPMSGWQRLEEVPGEVVRSLVRAGADALRAVPPGVATSAGESLLDHEALTVSAAGRTVAVPMRVLTALARMGFLGASAGGGGAGGGGAPSADLVVVSAAGGWVRLAAAYGSAYHRRQPGLGLSPR